MKEIFGKSDVARTFRSDNILSQIRLSDMEENIITNSHPKYIETIVKFGLKELTQPKN